MLNEENKIISNILSEWNHEVTFCEFDGQYIGELEKLLDEFIALIEKHEVDITEALLVKDSLLLTIQKTYEGLWQDAYSKILYVIKILKDRNSRLALCSLDDLILGAKENGVDLFRARLSEDYMAYKASDMQHIPFEKRQFSVNGRFSLAGLPCTYLGNSSFCCWVEMGRPPINQLNVSYARADADLHYLNLLCLHHDQEGTIAEINDWIVLKMLQISTSFIINEKQRKFKSEYIISQMIMRVCRKLNIDGVVYYSNRLDRGIYSWAAINVVVIPNYDSVKRFANNDTKLKLFDSENFAMYKELSNPEKNGEDVTLSNVFSNGISYGNSLFLIDYKHTSFYKFDRYLKKMYTQNIK